MKSNAKSEFVSWQYGPGAEIEYLPAVLEELRGLAVERLVACGDGGHETGGVLYGLRDANRLRILASANLACEHVFDPGCVLAGSDRSSLARLLQAPAGYEAIGWYRTRIMRGLDIERDDLKVLEQFFGAEKSVLLALQPSSEGSCSAAFSVREPGGQIVPSAIQEFSIQPLEPHREGAPEPRSNAKEKTPVPSAPLADLTESWPPADIPFRHRGRLAAVVVGILLVLAIAVITIYRRPHHSHQLALRASAISPGLVRIEWDRNSIPVGNGVSGSLEILDGNSVKTIPLDIDQLRQSSVIYSQQSRDIVVSLRVDASGDTPATSEESIVFSEGAEEAVAPEVVGALRQSMISNAARREAAMPTPPVDLQPRVNPARGEQSPAGPSTVEQRQAGESSVEERSSVQRRDGMASNLSIKKFEPSFAAPNKRTALIPLLPAAPASQMGSVQTPLPDMFAMQAAPQPTIRKPDSQTPVPQIKPQHAVVPSGRLIWTGDLARDGVVAINGTRASAGSLSGSLSPVIAEYRVFPAEFTRDGLNVYTTDGAAHGHTDPPSKSNGWNTVHFVFDPVRASELVVLEVPGPVNHFSRLVVRNTAKTCAVMVIEWKAQLPRD